jgi:putative endonuclease
MTLTRQRTGQAAEDLVARRVAAAGWQLIERNARTRLGEIDLVALDGPALVFVEVKAGRRGSRYGPERPVLAVGPRKQARLRRLAAAWMAANRGRVGYREIRFDVVGVSYGGADEAPEVEHLRAAF